MAVAGEITNDEGSLTLIAKHGKKVPLYSLAGENLSPFNNFVLFWFNYSIAVSLMLCCSYHSV
jgi:hypothetical protein